MKGRPMHWSLLYWGGGANMILGCLSNDNAGVLRRACKEAIRGDMGIDTLRSRRDRMVV